MCARVPMSKLTLQIDRSGNGGRRRPLPPGDCSRWTALLIHPNCNLAGRLYAI